MGRPPTPLPSPLTLLGARTGPAPTITRSQWVPKNTRVDSLTSTSSSSRQIDHVERAWRAFIAQRSPLVFETDHRAAEREMAFISIQKALDPHQVESFGSTAQGLSTPSSDIDLNCYGASASVIVQLIRTRLPSASDIRLIKRARVPLVCFTVDGFHVDVTSIEDRDNEEMEHHRDVTEWVKTRLIDQDLGHAALFVKAWARTHDIGSSRRSTLPSLAYLVILAAFAMANEPKERQAPLSLFNLFTGVSTADLRSRLFYDTAQQGIKGREGEIIDELVQSTRQSSLNTGFGQRMFVLDPLLPSINLARFVDDASVDRIRRAFQSAARDLLDPNVIDPFEQMLHSDSER